MGDVNSLVVSTGEVIGDGMLSVPLNILDFAMRSGEDGGCAPWAGD